MAQPLLKLGVNIDHVATLRQARLTRYPDPVAAVFAAIQGGADSITLHLREDRRHIQERDVELIAAVLEVPLNFEMALSAPMLTFAEKIQPAYVCLVPEKRAELTTEGGLDVVLQTQKITAAVARLQAFNAQVSLFIDPLREQITAALATRANAIELHTGEYAAAKTDQQRAHELKRIIAAAAYAADKGLIVNAGHGLNYQNVQAIAALPLINELNIGHAIISQAIFVGLQSAVRTMKDLMLAARN